jgi:hypothetical protein
MDASNGPLNAFTEGMGVIVAKGGDSCNAGNMKASAGSVYLNFATGISRAEGFCTQESVADGSWHSVKIVVQRLNTVSITIDGHPTVGMMTQLGGRIIFPQVRLGNGSWGGHLQGELKEVQLDATATVP